MKKHRVELMLIGALIPLLTASGAEQRTFSDSTTPTPAEVAAANDPAHAYQTVVALNVTINLTALHPAVDRGRLDCWCAGGQGGAGPDSLATMMTQLRTDPDASARGHAGWKLQQLAAQGPYWRTQDSVQFPISGGAYQATQAVTFLMVPQQLQDPASKQAYSPAAVLTHCGVSLHLSGRSAQDWKPALAILTGTVPTTFTNYNFVANTSIVDSYVVSELPKAIAAPSAKNSTTSK